MQEALLARRAPGVEERRDDPGGAGDHVEPSVLPERPRGHALARLRGGDDGVESANAGRAGLRVVERVAVREQHPRDPRGARVEPLVARVVDLLLPVVPRDVPRDPARRLDRGVDQVSHAPPGGVGRARVARRLGERHQGQDRARDAPVEGVGREGMGVELPPPGSPHLPGLRGSLVVLHLLEEPVPGLGEELRLGRVGGKQPFRERRRSPFPAPLPFRGRGRTRQHDGHRRQPEPPHASPPARIVPPRGAPSEHRSRATRTLRAPDRSAVPFPTGLG